LRLRKRLTAWLQVRTQQRRTIQPDLPTLQSHATQPSPASRLNRGEQSSRTRRLCRATQRNPAQPANSAEPHNATQPRQLSSQIHGTKQHVKADTSLRKSGRAGPKKQPNLWACALLARRACHMLATGLPHTCLSQVHITRRRHDRGGRRTLGSPRANNDTNITSTRGASYATPTIQIGCQQQQSSGAADRHITTDLASADPGGCSKPRARARGS